MSRIVLYDIQGKLISIEFSNMIMDIPRMLTAGIYLLQMHTEKGIYHRRLVVE